MSADIRDQKIGIVIPVYKLRRDYLEQCLQSALSQSHSNIEIVLVDDCSPDDSGKICDEIANWDSRITVVHHLENQGLPIARNSGIDTLDVNWYLFLDGDDWIDSDACDRLLKSAAQYDYDVDIVIGSGYRSYPAFEESAIFVENTRIIDTETDLLALQIRALSSAKRGFAQPIAIDSACFKLVNSRLFKKNGLRFQPLRYREDGMFFQEAVEVSKTVLLTPICFYHYRMTGDSMVNGYNPQMPDLHKQYLNCLWDFASRTNKTEAYYEALYYAAFLSMQICITQCFYHPENSAKGIEKRRACKAYFEQEPYCGMIDRLDLKSLSRNHLIKAICIKVKWYSGVQLLRSFYLLRNNKRAFE